MISFIKNSFTSRPLRFALIAGLCFRLLSVVFSKGYGMHDDHFLVAEAAQSWVDGYDYNKWLPNPDGTGTPGGHSWFYVGIHYGLFYSMDSIRIEDPQVKMFFIRLIHAFYSLLVILFTFKIIIELTNNTRWAGYGALMISLLWFMPMFSVRNLVEVVCIPPLMGAMLYLIRFDKQRLWKYIFYSGLLVGVAVGIRFQVLFFVAGMGLFILLRRKVWHAAVFGMMFLVALFITQIGDLILW